jgi:hypothetical protein
MPACARVGQGPAIFADVTWRQTAVVKVMATSLFPNEINMLRHSAPAIWDADEPDVSYGYS